VFAGYDLPSWRSCCYEAGSLDCLSTSNVSTIKRDFFTDFPNKAACDGFVDRAKFELLTIAADGVMLRGAENPTSQKIDWITRHFAITNLCSRICRV